MAETKTQTLLGDPPVPHARPATARRPATRSVIRTGPSPPSLSLLRVRPRFGGWIGGEGRRRQPRFVLKRQQRLFIPSLCEPARKLPAPSSRGADRGLGGGGRL